MKTISNESLANVTGGFAPISVIAGGGSYHAYVARHHAPTRVPQNTAGWIIKNTKVPPGFKIE